MCTIVSSTVHMYVGFADISRASEKIIIKRPLAPHRRAVQEGDPPTGVQPTAVVLLGRL